MQNKNTKIIINPRITPDTLNELKTIVIKILQDNAEDIQTKIINQRLPINDVDDNFKIFVFKQYESKQKQIDNISTFVFKFIASLQEYSQEISFLDNKILELRESLEKATDVILNMQDENEMYKQKVIEAETYIDWIQQQKQFIDLIGLSGQKTLQKCRSQKRLYSNGKIEDLGYMQKSKKRQRVDYQRLKQYISDLKQQKNSLIKQYNILLEKYNLKKKECEKANLLLNQFSKKQLKQQRYSVSQHFKNQENSSSSSAFNNFSTKKQSKDFTWTLDRSQRHYSQQQFVRKTIKNLKDPSSKKYRYQPFQFDCEEKSFQKDIKKYKNTHSYADVGVNTKKLLFLEKYTQFQQISENKSQKEKGQVKQSRNSNSFKMTEKQINSTKPNSQFDCEISISIKGNNKNLFLNKDLTKLLDLNSILQHKQKGFTKCKKLVKNNAKNEDISNQVSKYSCSKDVNEENKLCNHMYCYFTNKIVDDRIKKYKYIKGKGKK